MGGEIQRTKEGGDATDIGLYPNVCSSAGLYYHSRLWFLCRTQTHKLDQYIGVGTYATAANVHC